MSDVAPDDEYAVTYRHLGRRINITHWESKEDDGNRRLALDHASRLATSMDVEDLRVARRPKIAWEQCDWKAANSADEPSVESTEPSAPGP